MALDGAHYGRHPDTVLTLGMCGGIGLLQLATAEVSDAILALVPHAAAMFWAAAFALSAVAALAGVFWRDRVDGWLIELVARIVLTATAAAYTYALALAITRPGGYLVVGIFAGIALASAVRVAQLVRRLRQYRADLTEVGRGR